MATKEEPEFSLKETIAALDGWLFGGVSFFPIDTAISARFWISLSPPSLLRDAALSELDAWLNDETPEMSDELCAGTLLQLQSIASPHHEELRATLEDFEDFCRYLSVGVGFDDVDADCRRDGLELAFLTHQTMVS